MHWNANYNYEPVQPTSAMDRKDGPRRSTPDTVEFYNERTRKIERENKVIYLFRYKDDENDKNEVITWYWLKKLKDDKQWRILYHPMILNFINERLIEHSFLYFLHILAYLTFLLILSSYIFDKHALQDVIATIFLLVFGFFLVVKGAIKLRNGHVSRWFICSYLFNIVTYGTTLLYIWTPQLFAYDNYNDDLKYIVAWLLPIIAIISAWLNFLYILRKSPFGIYILMMTKILHTFAQIAVIWIPTLFAFAFAFHLVMRNSGTEPWESDDLFKANATVARKFLGILQAITKTSAMMIGEVDADNLLGRKEWIPSVLLLVFEVTTVILLMNLMISLAVGDVNELRHSAQEKLLQIKVNFAIEMLQLAEYCECFDDMRLFSIYSVRSTNNVLVIDNDGTVYSMKKKGIDFGGGAHNDEYASSTPKIHLNEYRSNNIALHTLSNNTARNEISSRNHNYVRFAKGDIEFRVRRRALQGISRFLVSDIEFIPFIERTDSEIADFPSDSTINGHKSSDVSFDDCTSSKRRFAQWLIGVDWTSILLIDDHYRL